MRVPLDNETSGDYEQRPDAVGPKPYAWTEVIRSWLVSGVHPFTIDPRRRIGRHGSVRRLLLNDRSSATGGNGQWRDLISAFQRHTLQSGLARLSAEERQVITLAYVEGHTNRQIAATLGVSVTTARRRLVVALARLEEYFRRSGTWISSVVLLGLAYVISRLGRLADGVRSAEWSQPLAATLAAGAVTTTAVVALVVAGPQDYPVQHRLTPATAHSILVVPAQLARSMRPPHLVPSPSAISVAGRTRPAAADSKDPSRLGARRHNSHHSVQLD